MELILSHLARLVADAVEQLDEPQLAHFIRDPLAVSAPARVQSTAHVHDFPVRALGVFAQGLGEGFTDGAARAALRFDGFGDRRRARDDEGERERERERARAERSRSRAGRRRAHGVNAAARGRARTRE